MRQSRKTALNADPGLLYVDSSALVKLVIDEPESVALERHLHGSSRLATSRLAWVEVTRAVRLASPLTDAHEKARRLLLSCMLIDVSDSLLRDAAELASASLRALDAIHLASAHRIDPDELVTYDRRLTAAGTARGLLVASPGLPS